MGHIDLVDFKRAGPVRPCASPALPTFCRALAEKTSYSHTLRCSSGLSSPRGCTVKPVTGSRAGCPLWGVGRQSEFAVSGWYLDS